LFNQAAVNDFFKQEQPLEVYLATAMVGGIHANKNFLVNFVYDNLMAQAKVIYSAFMHGVKKLLILGFHLHLHPYGRATNSRECIDDWPA
jgi:GDP-L-fucose synthase